MNRRSFLKNLSLIGLGTLTPKSILSSPIIHLPKERNIAIFYPSHCASPIVFAQQKRWFEEMGLRVKLINFESMPKLFLTFQRDKDKFIAAQIPSPMVVIDSAKKLINNEPPLVALSVLGVHGSALIARADSQIAHTRDLKNKKVATPAVRVIHNLLLRIFLEKYNLKVERDLQLVELTLDQVLPKFQQKEVDAILFPEPIPSLAETVVNSKTIISNQFIWKNHPCCLLTTHPHHLEKEKNLLRDLNTVIVKSARYINPPGRREELIVTLKESPFHKASLTDEVMKRAFRPGRSDFDPYLYKSTALLLVDLLKNYQFVPKFFDTKVLVDYVFKFELIKESYKVLNIPHPQSDYRYEIIMGEAKMLS